MGHLQLLVATLMATAAGKKCYDCGYQVNNWNTGSNVQEKHPLPEVKQCGDEALMGSNVVDCGTEDECCGSVREFYVYGDAEGRPGHIDMVARHACEKTLADSFSFDLICTDHLYTCFNVSYEDIQEQEATFAKACFCEGDNCNNDVPPMPAPTTGVPDKPTTTSCPECRQCYNCGYMKDSEEGEASALPDLTLCGDFATPTDIVATCGLGDCCGSLKEYVFKLDETSGKNTTVIIGRHGCVSEIDHLSHYSATCKDNGESCFQVDDASLPHDGESTVVQAEICMCDRDRCNNDDPIPDIPTTTTAPDKTTTTSCPECRQCYNCGYMKDSEDGEASKLPELAFCSDFSTPTDIVATCGLGDCCGSLKEYIIMINETSGANTTKIIGRHGCVSDIDHLSEYSATCKDNGESCFQVDDASLPNDHGESTVVQAEICMCDRDRCNNDDPIPDIATTTMAPGSADKIAVASVLVLVMGMLSLY